MSINIVKEIALEVREFIVSKYGEDFLDGKCIESSDLIVDKLQLQGYKAWTVEGWCEYECNFEGCSDRPYGEHTWSIAIVDGKEIYIDVTATQFQYYFYDLIPEIIVGEQPFYIFNTEPIWSIEFDED